MPIVSENIRVPNFINRDQVQCPNGKCASIDCNSRMCSSGFIPEEDIACHGDLSCAYVVLAIYGITILLSSTEIFIVEIVSFLVEDGDVEDKLIEGDWWFDVHIKDSLFIGIVDERGRLEDGESILMW